jgi:murein peptide amidase A
MSYTGPALDVPRFYADLPPAAEAAGFTVEKYGKAANWPLFVLHRDAAHADAPTIYLSAGIHGDEPAGPLALLRLLHAGFFDDRRHWLIFPALNPAGLAAKTRTNPGGVDLNRDYRAAQSSEARQHLDYLKRREAAGRARFALTLLLHEDWETKGYYLYELNRSTRPLLGPAVLAAVDPICGVDRSPIIEGMEAHNGLITRPIEGFEERPLWPEALWLALHHTDRSLTLEAPSAQKLPPRVAAHDAAVRVAIAAAGL